MQCLDTAPLDGTRIEVSRDGKHGVLVYRRKTKVVDRKKLRYIEDFRWTDVFRKEDIDYEPKFWRSYDPDTMYPLPAA